MSNFDENLTPVLYRATNADLAPLVGYIMKGNISERLSNNDLYKREAPVHTKYVGLIEREIRQFGGNSFLNLFRDSGPPYYEIVCDVADKLGANYNKESSIAEVESAIMLRIMSQSWEKMNDEERQVFLKEMGLGSGVGSLPKALPVAAIQVAISSTGFLAYRIAVIVANAVARQVLGSGLTLAANAAITRSIAVFAGPIGWAITGIWTAVDLAGPAYRVTTPCVVHIAMLRQQYAQKYCAKCSAPYTSEAKFCQSCGASLS